MADNITAKDGNGSTFTIRSTDLGSGIQAVHHRITDGSGNLMPSLDAAARRGYVTVTDGTNSMPTMDAAARRGYVTVTDGTNSMPTMDVKGRRGWVQPTDGTNDFLSASAANIAAQTGINAQMVVGAGEWTATSAPAAGTLASASKTAGGGGVRHVCREISVSWASDGSANGGAQNVTLVLRDGATGAGTILMQWSFQRLTTTPTDAANNGSFSLTGLNIPGTAATAMTLEFSGTAGTHEVYTANIGGYDVS